MEYRDRHKICIRRGQMTTKSDSLRMTQIMYSVDTIVVKKKWPSAWTCVRDARYSVTSTPSTLQPHVKDRRTCVEDVHNHNVFVV